MKPAQIKEFLSRLEGPEGCDFHEAAGETKWKCKGGNDKSLAQKILTGMKIPKTEQRAFLKRCESLGGFCDCEILFNAADGLVKPEKKKKPKNASKNSI